MASHMMDVQEDDPMSAGDVAAAAADHPEDAARYVINNNQKVCSVRDDLGEMRRRSTV